MSTRTRDAGFAEFWAAYPRKVGKPKAQLAYRRALGRISGADPPGSILAGLTAHLPAWAETEPDLVPHPTTWLTRDGWDDQPPTNRRARAPNDRSHRPADADVSRDLNDDWAHAAVLSGCA